MSIPDKIDYKSEYFRNFDYSPFKTQKTQDKYSLGSLAYQELSILKYYLLELKKREHQRSLSYGERVTHQQKTVSRKRNKSFFGGVKEGQQRPAKQVREYFFVKNKWA